MATQTQLRREQKGAMGQQACPGLLKELEVNQLILRQILPTHCQKELFGAWQM